MIEQPSSAPTKKEIAQALENARNNVSILEAESVRLDRLIGSQKRELIAQEGAKRDIEDLTKVAEGNLAILDTQMESLESSKIALEADLEAKKTELVAREEAVLEAEQAVKQREATVLSREVAVIKNEEIFNQKNSAFEAVRDHQFKVVDKIEQAIQSL